MKRAAAILCLATTMFGQANRPPLSATNARELEAGLRANPGDRDARGSLLQYYFRTATLHAADAIPARRRHILWLIENTPADPMAGGPAATIDASGHRLADPQGFEQAAGAWRAQAAKPGAAAATLANAAYFFKLSDMGFAQTLLERAVVLEPANKEIGARLGDLYALSILGITMVNGNGFPTAADPALASGPMGQRARVALERSRNPYVVAKAGYMLSFQGSLLRGMRKLHFDAGALAESSLKRAVSLAPEDREVAALLNQHYQMQSAVRGR